MTQDLARINLRIEKEKAEDAFLSSEAFFERHPYLLPNKESISEADKEEYAEVTEVRSGRYFVLKVPESRVPCMALMGTHGRMLAPYALINKESYEILREKGVTIKGSVAVDYEGKMSDALTGRLVDRELKNSLVAGIKTLEFIASK